MNKSWRFLLFLIWLMYLLICGVLLFTKGFLLSRKTLPHKSSCVEETDCKELQKLAQEKPSVLNQRLYLECLDKDQLQLRRNTDITPKCTKHDQKVILLVVDALKYEFADYNDSLVVEERFAYQNRLPIFNELIQTLPNNTRLYKFIANPPTTTMQRLKGLTTGSLPTFIDIGSNFATSEINEDNILDQLNAVGKNIVFMGDDTWIGLYPNRFLRQYPYPSFNVWDLDTVDNGIIKHLKPEIHNRDWDLLIAHFLGVDHCGHRYGPFHDEMSRKLDQINNIVRDIVDTMDDNTLLFVIGDHGMTQSGDHGGDSIDEVTSAMFIYSSLPLTPPDSISSTNEVNQVDLVPTLANILGFAIPFSNLGKVIIDALPIPNNNIQMLETEWTYLLDTLLINIEQIMLYINTYSRETNLFSKDKISAMLQGFYNLKKKLVNIDTVDDFKLFKKESIDYMNFVRSLCEEVWVQFDSFSMSRGLVLTFLLLTFSFFIIEGIPGDEFIRILNNGFLWLAYSIALFGVIISFSLEYLKIIDDGLLLTYVFTLTLSIFLMAILVVQNWETVTNVWFTTIKFQEPIDICSRLVHICCLCTVFSNSFVVEEGIVLCYLLNSLVWVIAFSTRTLKIDSKSKNNDKSHWFEKIVTHSKYRAVMLAFVVSALVRLSFNFWRCREEQHWCVKTSGEVNSKLTKTNMEHVSTLVTLALFVSVCRMWLRSCGNLVGFSPTVTLARYTPTVIVVCTGGFWVLHGLPNETRSKLIVPWQLQLLPRVVYSLVVINFICLLFKPLCVYVLEKKTDLISVYGHEDIIPQLFHQVKEVMKKSNSKSNGSNLKQNPVVYGLATSFSCVFVILLQFTSLVIILLLGETLSSSIVIMLTTILILLCLFAYNRLEHKIVAAQLFSVPWSFVLCWGLLSSYYFYGTGHQPTFSGIQWYSAFVGTGGEFSTFVIPAALVGINTYSSQIITSLSLPLLLIAPFTLYTISPKWLNINTYKDDDELKQGELYMYEKEGLTQYAMFKLTSKYIFYHGTRIFACMLSAAIHCRHLMVWMIFAPKLIFEGVGFFVTLASLLVGYIFMMKIHSSIDRLMDKLLKTHR